MPMRETKVPKSKKVPLTPPAKMPAKPKKHMKQFLIPQLREQGETGILMRPLPFMSVLAQAIEAVLVLYEGFDLSFYVNSDGTIIGIEYFTTYP